MLFFYYLLFSLASSLFGFYVSRKKNSNMSTLMFWSCIIELMASGYFHFHIMVNRTILFFPEYIIKGNNLFLITAILFCLLTAYLIGKILTDREFS